MGHIRKKSPGSYQIVTDAGLDPVTGKRRQIWKTIKGSHKVALQALGELENSIRQGDLVERNNITLGEWLNRWFKNHVVNNLVPRTAVSYRKELNTHIIRKLGAIPLQKLTPQHLEDYKEQALKEGRVDGKGGLAPQTVRYHLNILNGALKQAARLGYVTRNVAQLVDRPRVRRPVITTMLLAHVPFFLAATRDNFYYAVFYAALWTGMRLGELLGLRWCDVNLDQAYLSVVQTLYKHAGISEMGEPKSSHSRRRITLSPSLEDILKGHRMEQEARGIMLGRNVMENDLVFCYPGGKPLDPSTVNHAFSKALQEAGLPHIRFHDLRHTHATILFQAGVHPKVVSERLGHSSVAFTLDTYSHMIPGLQEAAAERFDRFVSSVQGDVEKNVGKASELAQAQSAEVMLADPSLDVAKMLPNLLKKLDIIREFETEPHRSRTCNLLIKSQLLCQLS